MCELNSVNLVRQFSLSAKSHSCTLGQSLLFLGFFLQNRTCPQVTCRPCLLVYALICTVSRGRSLNMAFDLICYPLHGIQIPWDDND